LGPEYSDAVLDSFLEKLEYRFEERLGQSIPRKRVQAKPLSERTRAVLSGMALGGGAVGIPLSILGHDYTATYHPVVADLWTLILVGSIISSVAGLAKVRRRRD